MAAVAAAEVGSDEALLRNHVACISVESYGQFLKIQVLSFLCLPELPPLLSGRGLPREANVRAASPDTKDPQTKNL